VGISFVDVSLLKSAVRDPICMEEIGFISRKSLFATGNDSSVDANSYREIHVGSRTPHRGDQILRNIMDITTPTDTIDHILLLSNSHVKKVSNHTRILLIWQESRLMA